jgi:hypothetical protein
MYFSRCFLAAICLSCPLFGAGKEPKGAKAPATPAHGVKTPGVLIPLGNLKSEAEITLASAPTGFLFTESIALADSTGIHRLDAKTNKSFDPPRDIKDVDKPCGGLLSAFSFVWTVSCGNSTLAKLEVRPVRGPGRGRGGPPADGPEPEAPKEEVSKAEPPKPEPPPRTPPAPPAFIAIGTTPIAPSALAASPDSVWLLADGKTSLQRIDPKENAIVAEVRLPSACTSILFAEGSLWVTCPSETRVLRIDPRTNLVDKRIEVPAQPVSVAAGESSIWVLCRKEGKIARIDPKTNKVSATIELSIPNSDGMLAFGEGSLWASAAGFPVIRIAPATDKVVQQFHGEGGGFIYFGLGSVWVASGKSGTVTRFDPKRVMATLAE